MTSGLTLLVVIALLIFGGPTLRGFQLPWLLELSSEPTLLYMSLVRWRY